MNRAVLPTFALGWLLIAVCGAWAAKPNIEQARVLDESHSLRTGHRHFGASFEFAGR